MTARTVVGGRYAVERIVGHGGMATVALARDGELGRRVAIKRLSEALTGDEIFRERFLREARMAAQLAHPNIVAVFDVGEEGGVPYIVMEYVDGETLADLTSRTGPLDADRAVDLALQACAGLEHAHAAGLVHRDVKPQNLLVGADDTLKIADFGIARPVDGTQLTLAGTVLGTAAYLSPEQALGEQVTGAADIYSLGAVLYELLAGRPPYTFDSLDELSVKQRQGPPPSLPAASPELEGVVRRCLAADPAQRPPSAAALARELSESSAESATDQLPAPRATTATRVVARPRRTFRLSAPRVALAGALGAAALAGGLALGLGVGRDDPSPPPARPARADVLPRGETPAASARKLADWLRARAG
ncbi:MAG TPA: serine/threonine-protein kinase [Gaiellaceae bacterium]|nr:serine/threonine-protein kinase [Gaiellaceae bacterium]